MVVEITPTYSGCPALETITVDVEAAVRGAGFGDVLVRRVLSPPWSTDDITDRGRAQLAAHGIAPPSGVRGPVGGGPGQGPVEVRLTVRCPHCGSPDTEETSHFAATACTALWRCRTCAEPFEHVKPL